MGCSSVGRTIEMPPALFSLTWTLASAWRSADAIRMAASESNVCTRIGELLGRRNYQNRSKGEKQFFSMFGVKNGHPSCNRYSEREWPFAGSLMLRLGAWRARTLGVGLPHRQSVEIFIMYMSLP